MLPLTCIAIDDEPLALKVIETFCQRYGNITLATYTNPIDGLRAIEHDSPDIVFLDIKMDQFTGLDLAPKLPRNTCCIFTTAYSQYALDGFNLDATDYLQKPFSYDRFVVAVEKAVRRLPLYNQEPTSITVKQEYNNVVIPFDNILYIEAMENYTKFVLVEGHYILSHINLKTLFERLPRDKFIRIHKSYIIPIKGIKTFTYKDVTLSNGQVLPVGKQYTSRVMEVLKS